MTISPASPVMMMRDASARANPVRARDPPVLQRHAPSPRLPNRSQQLLRSVNPTGRFRLLQARRGRHGRSFARVASPPFQMPEASVLAQVVGGVGFGLLVLSTFARARLRFLLIDIAGLVPVIAHYVILAAPVGAALSAFYMLSDVVAAFSERRAARVAFWLFYPLAVAIGWVFWAGPADLLAIVGTVLAVAARHQRSVWRIQALILVSTIGWGTYGLLVGSVVQVAFSMIYGVAALANAVRFFRQQSPSPAAEPGQLPATR